jgi:hypothetical protein
MVILIKNPLNLSVIFFIGKKNILVLN